jgi:hypothetical protein
MAVVTPTYARDLDLFGDLHESVLRHFPAHVRHLAVVNDSDLPAFHRFEGARCSIIGVSDALPRSVSALPLVNLWVNLRHPVPPLRGWIIQQLVKLSVVSQMSERIIVLADSDLVFIRPVSVETFAPGGLARLYRLDDGVDESLPRHLRWHAVAHELLGLPPIPPPPLPDYVSSLNVWDRDIALRMLRRMEQVTKRRWLEAVGPKLHFSEWTLYGVYADQLEGAQSVVPTEISLCHSYWDPTALTIEQAAAWLSCVGSQDVAYMISAKSHTPHAVRRAAHSRVFAT